MPVPSTTMDEEHVHGGDSILATPIGNDRGGEREREKKLDEKIESMRGNRMRGIPGEILGFSERATLRGSRC